MTDAASFDVLLAGATGNLGGRIARALRGRGASVHALVRPGTDEARLAPLREAGIIPVAVDLRDRRGLTQAAYGAGVVVSAVNGLREVIVDQQANLLDAAVAARVPRFIPSDFAADLFRVPEGANRNFDLRREFDARLDEVPIRATSILNGGFADMLAGQAPFVIFPLRRAIHFGDPDQPIDFTTMDDVAAYTAAAALDPETPRVLRIAGSVTSARGLAEDASAVTGRRFKTLRLGSLERLEAITALLKRIAPGTGQIFPPWQGMQYMHNMFSGEGKLLSLDNGRYPGIAWTSVRAVLAQAHRG